MSDVVFTPSDLEVLADAVVSAWTAGIDRDWSVPAGTVEWSCLDTADHAVDATLAPAFFLASRRTDAYPDWGWGESHMGDAATPELLIEAMSSVVRIVAAVVASTPPDVEAILFRRPEIVVAHPADFAPRSALEMVLHGHDVCAGLGMPLDPPLDACRNLREHTRDWLMWKPPFWSPLGHSDDPFHDLPAASGRA